MYSSTCRRERAITRRPILEASGRYVPLDNCLLYAPTLYQCRTPILICGVECEVSAPRTFCVAHHNLDYHLPDPLTQKPFRGGTNSLEGFKAVLKVLSRFNLVNVLDLSRYHSARLEQTIGWASEKKNVVHHKKSSKQHDSFVRDAFRGCIPETSGVPTWKNRYPFKPCITEGEWGAWNEAAYFGEKPTCF